MEEQYIKQIMPGEQTDFQIFISMQTNLRHKLFRVFIKPSTKIAPSISKRKL